MSTTLVKWRVYREYISPRRIYLQHAITLSVCKPPQMANCVFSLNVIELRFTLVLIDLSADNVIINPMSYLTYPPISRLTF